LAVRGLGCPVRFHLTAGHRGDAPQAGPLIEGLAADVVMADTAYDADHLRQAIAAKGAIAVIPNNPSRAKKHPLDAHLYAQRPGRMLLLKAQTVQARRHPLREDRQKLPRRHHPRRHHPLAALNVHSA